MLFDLGAAGVVNLPKARDYLGMVAKLPCCVKDCGYWPVEVHHRTGAGMALKAEDYETMPLCHRHHRTGGFGVAIHAGQKTWEKTYGRQDDFIKETRDEVCSRIANGES